ncbi:hypothetical protein GCM10027610_093090 [Dactylosporangium cerinum]
MAVQVLVLAVLDVVVGAGQLAQLRVHLGLFGGRVRDEEVRELAEGVPPVCREIGSGTVPQCPEQRLEPEMIGDDHIDDISHPVIVPHTGPNPRRRLEC